MKVLSRFATILSLAAALAACGTLGADTPAPQDSSFVVADLFATPGKSLATLEPSPSVQPSATVFNVGPATLAPTLSLPTVVILQPNLPTQPPFGGLLLTPTIAPLPIPTEQVCSADPPLPFAAVWQNTPQAKALLGCPAGSPQTVSGLWQPFERGVMFERDSDHSIFIISDANIRQQGKLTDAWWRLMDTWQADESDADPSLTAPTGLLQPLRGFGKVWRSNAFVRQAVGWATADAAQIESQWLNFDRGWMMTGPNGAPIYVMLLGDADQTVGTHLAPSQ